MSKVPPARVVSLTESARQGLSNLRRKMVPPNLAALDVVSDFWGFNIVFTLAELGILDQLSEGTTCSSDVARVLELDADATYRLLRASSQLGLVEELPGRQFSISPVGASLCAGCEASFRDFILFMGRYGAPNWQRLPDCVRTGKTAIELRTGMAPFEWFEKDPEAQESFNRAMTAVSSLVGDALVAALDFSGFRKIVDIGGGHGQLLSTVLGAAPTAYGVLFDLPSVVAGAADREETIGPRIKCIGGSFFDHVPAGGDCYLAKSIIHDWSDEDAIRILVNIRKGINAGGRLMLCEAVVTPANKPHLAKFLDIEMLVHAGGRERTEAQYAELLSLAGFELLEIVPTAGPMSVVLGQPVG